MIREYEDQITTSPLAHHFQPIHYTERDEILNFKFKTGSDLKVINQIRIHGY